MNSTDKTIYSSIWSKKRYPGKTSLSHSSSPGLKFKSKRCVALGTTSNPPLTPFALNNSSNRADMLHGSSSSFSPWMINVGTVYSPFRNRTIGLTAAILSALGVRCQSSLVIPLSNIGKARPSSKRSRTNSDRGSPGRMKPRPFMSMLWLS